MVILGVVVMVEFADRKIRCSIVVVSRSNIFEPLRRQYGIEKPRRGREPGYLILPILTLPLNRMSHWTSLTSVSPRGRS